MVAPHSLAALVESLIITKGELSDPYLNPQEIKELNITQPRAISTMEKAKGLAEEVDSLPEMIQA